MLGNILSALLFLLNPGPTPTPPPAPPGSLNSEDAAAYEAQYLACAGTFNPDQCRADLYDRYFG